MRCKILLLAVQRHGVAVFFVYDVSQQLRRAEAVRYHWRGDGRLAERARRYVRQSRVAGAVFAALQALQYLGVMLADKKACGDVDKLVTDEFFAHGFHFGAALGAFAVVGRMYDFFDGQVGGHFLVRALLLAGVGGHDDRLLGLALLAVFPPPPPRRKSAAAPRRRARPRFFSLF